MYQKLIVYCAMRENKTINTRNSKSHHKHSFNKALNNNSNDKNVNSNNNNYALNYKKTTISGLSPSIQ